MRLVKYMNDAFYKDMISELECGFQNLAWKFDHYSPGDYPRPQRITIGSNVFPFPLAAEIYRIYQYLVGYEEAPENMYDTLNSLCELVWVNPFTSKLNYNIEWELWERTKLGLFVRCSFIAIQLEAGESINSKQLALMTGLTTPGVVKKIRDGHLKAVKKGRTWVISADDALSFIKSQVEK